MNIDYCAGFFDGEGCISLSKSGRLVLAVQQNDLRPLEVLVQVLGGKIYGPMTRTNNYSQEHPYWVWRVQGWKEAVGILQHLEPHLILKRDKAQEALRRAVERGFLPV